jgi:hypothetical protein
MKCKFGHAHPPTRVIAVGWEPSGPGGPQPYHCPDCPEVTKSGVEVGYWEEYASPVNARRAGHASPCRQCFSKNRP